MILRPKLNAQSLFNVGLKATNPNMAAVDVDTDSLRYW